MTVPRLRTQVDPPVAKLKQRLQEARQSMSHLEIPNAKAAVYLDRWVQSNFRTEGGKVGGWEPFRYGGRLTAGGIDTSARLLQDTGRLRASFVPFWSRRDAGIGSDLPYSRTHHEGIGNTPERRLLPYRREVMPDLRKLYGLHISNVLAALGRGVRRDKRTGR